MHLSPGPCESPGKTGLDWVAFKLCLVWLCLLPVVLAAKNLPWDAVSPLPPLFWETDRCSSVWSEITRTGPLPLSVFPSSRE